MEKSDSVNTSKYEKFVTRQVHRSQLTDAPYNPRKITPAAKAKLRRIVEKLGMLEPIVWNERSGRIVGGHQRIRALDDLEGTANYSLTVAVVQLSDAQEKQANIALNNPSAQGEFEWDKFQDIAKSDGFDYEAAGFDTADMYSMFGDASTAIVAAPADLADMAEKLRAGSESHERVRASLDDLTNVNYYCVLVFRSDCHRAAFAEALALPSERFLDGRLLANLLDVDLDARVQDMLAQERAEQERAEQERVRTTTLETPP